METQDRELDPNANSKLLFGEEHLVMFYLAGILIGRAVYDDILLDCVFSKILLRRMLSKRNLFQELRLKDVELYKHLITVRDYKGDARDLMMTFAVTDMYSKKEIELIKDGSNIPVTNENKIKYIYYYSYYILNVQNKEQTSAFLQGISDIIPLSLLKLFTPQELQIIISGATAEINLYDLRENTIYKVMTEFKARAISQTEINM